MYIKQIDSLRFFAIMLVLVSHWLYGLPYVEELRLGTIGVEFFFVISGFLISLQLFDFKSAINERKEKFSRVLLIFYIRRILRIFPLYYLIVIISYLFNNGEVRDAFIWNICYLSNFYIIKVQHWPSTFSHFWSLSVEEHFYLFWPIIILLSRKKELPYIFILIYIFSILFRAFFYTHSQNIFIVNIHTLSCLDLFMVGGALAYIYTYKIELFTQLFSDKVYKYVILISFSTLYIILITRTDYGNFNWIFQKSLLGITYASFIGFIVTGTKGSLAIFLCNRYTVHLGKLSYAMYLVHNFIPGILLPIKKISLPFYIEFLVYFLVTLIICEILNKYFETPIRNLNKRFTIKT